MRVNKMNHPNQEIRYVVYKCHYYMSGDHFSTEKIEVQPRNAANAKETEGETFIYWRYG